MALGRGFGFFLSAEGESGQPLDIRPVVIEDEAHIGANSVVLAGITVGKRTQVGAGSVVTRDIPPYCIAVGNPCRVIRKFNETTGEWERV